MVLGLSKARDVAPYSTTGTINATWGAAMRSLMGLPQTAAIPLADEWSCMGLSAAWRCATLISDSCASLPMYAYTSADDGSQERLEPTPAVLTDPWPMIPRHNWTFGAVWSMLLRGDAFALPADPDPATGYPRQFPLLNPDQVWVDVDVITGMPVYHVGDVELGPGEILHIPGVCPPGSVRGIGVIEAHRRGLTAAAAMDAYGLNSWTTNGVPSGIITVDRPEVGKEQADDLKSRWMLGTSGKREPIVVPRSITFKELAFSPEDMAYVEARKLTAAEICWMFGVSPTMLGVSPANSMTYANVESLRSALAQESLMGWTSRIEQVLSKWVPRSLQVRFSYDAFLRSTTKERYESYAIGKAGGWLTNDEIRDWEHLARLPEQEPQPAVAPPQLQVVQGGAANA